MTDLNLPQTDTVGFFRFNVGTIRVTVLSDGSAGFAPMLYGVDQEPEAVSALLEAMNIPPTTVNSFANLLLLEDGERVTLVDSGWGGFRMPEGEANTGRLLPTLALLGVQPGDVTDLLLTHFHPDHVSGAVTADGQPAFPAARVHFPTVEQDFLTSGNAPDPIAPFVDHANTVLKPLFDANMVSLFNDGDEVVPGVTASHAPGHTPGHHTLLIESDGAQLFHMVDIANHYLISLAQPDWVFGIDTVPEQANATRKRVLGHVADERLRVVGYHFPFPGVGYVAREGDGFRFIPLV